MNRVSRVVPEQDATMSALFAEAPLTQPGEAYEITLETVGGHRYPMFKRRHKNLTQLLYAGRQFAGREALVVGDLRLTYEELIARVEAGAQWLRNKCDVRQGDRVAIYAENSAEWVIAFWSITSLGGVAVAMNGWWTEAEFADAWALTSPRLLLVDDKRLARLSDASRPAAMYSIREIMHADEAPVELAMDLIAEDDPALILFTSGTTGRAKAVQISHLGELGFVQTNQYAAACGLATMGLTLKDKPPSTVLGIAPFFHMSGVGGLILFTYAMGDKLVLQPGRFDPEAVLKLIEYERVTTWTLLGGMGPMVIETASRVEYDLSSVNVITFGGSRVSPKTVSALRQVFPNAACNTSIGYGATETVSVPVGFGGAEFEENPAATGSVNILHSLQIRNAAGECCGDGEEGEIWVRSAFTMQKYVNDEDATNAVFDDDRWYKTGDIGRIENGLLYVNARARDLIIRSAENIYPAEIENMLDSYAGVIESAVVGLPHAIHGQVPAGVIVVDSPSDFALDAMREWLAQRLAPFKIPECWRVVSRPLSRNHAGKIIKESVLQLFSDEQGEGGHQSK
ncbi:MAG: class I adenylate-forming enzyme family protein [Pseudomonadota bacterium]|nr:class I adenylate-forming enzyme family protein [Pseudomonadota bacterium]